MSRIDFDAVCKRFAPKLPLTINKLSLAIGDGEFCVFVGPSGCGKSTLLRMVAGLETISSGEIAIDGQRVNDLPPAQRDVAMVFQSYALYPHMTVAENMAFGLRVLGADKADIARRVDEGGRDPAARAAAGPAAQGAVGRAAPARGDRPRHRPAAARVPVRRAAVQPRRRAARADAARDRQAAPRPRQRQHDLRDPRPGRGDDAGRPDRAAAQPAPRSRPRAAWRRSARRWSCTTGRATCSSPTSSAARR